MLISKSGFTFVEVIISITIMAMFSIVGISSFEKFFKNSQMLNIKSKILSIIKNEDNNVISGDISSYKITFETGSKDIFVNENYYKNPQVITFSGFNLNNLSGSLITSNTSTGNWTTKVYVDNILNNTYILNGSGETINIDINTINDYEKIEINSSIDSIKSNKFILYKIDYSGRESDNSQETYINSLSGSELYGQISIENRIGTKRILVSTGTNSEQEYIGNIDFNITRGNQELTFKLDN